MTVTIYLPDSEPGPETVHLAPSPASFARLRIAVLENGKPNAALVMTRAAETLAERTGARVSLVTKKGPQGRSANAAIPCAPDIFELVLAQADIVITGSADCGSCTAYSVYDTIELEKAGGRAWSSPRRSCRSRRRWPPTSACPTPALVLDHPIGGPRSALHQRADAAAARRCSRRRGMTTRRRLRVCRSTPTRSSRG